MPTPSIQAEANRLIDKYAEMAVIKVADADADAAKLISLLRATGQLAENAGYVEWAGVQEFGVLHIHQYDDHWLEFRKEV